ncbi:MAG: HAMP domain-containing sensor histidine kinase [Methanomicrobiales archaeon]
MEVPHNFASMSIIRKWSGQPLPGALFVSFLLAVIMLPYWWLAVRWSGDILVSPDARFTFTATTFLLVLIIADSVFLVRYYQLVRKRELVEKAGELRRSEEALRVANKKLNLLSGITRHDIKNQLMALKGFLELSGDALDNREQLADFLSKELKIADSIERQINFTKDYEDMGINAPAWQNVNAIIASASRELPLNDVRIEVRQADLVVFADPLLVKVFYNLIDNSLRYGGDTMTMISLDAEEQDGSLLVIFGDDGAGISAGDKKRLFSKGYGKNSGLGLFLTREILSITGITITENGTPGRGARFEILVPPDKFRITKK